MESYGNRRFDNRQSGGGGNYQDRFVPVKVGDEATVTIEAVGEKGDGLAKIKGFVVFVPGGKQGQTVKVRVSRVLKKVAFAEIVGEGAPASEQSESADEGAEASEESSDDGDDYEGDEEF